MMLGKHDDSVAALEKSLELNPNFAKSYYGLGMTLVLSGRLDEAKDMIEKAVALSPRDPMMWAFTVVHAFACVLAGENDDAVRWSHKTMQNPHATGYWPHAVLAAACANLGSLEEAQAEIAIAIIEKPDLTLSYLKKALPTKHEGGLEPYLWGLRKAGLPE
jgi:adenylate cyclase